MGVSMNPEDAKGELLRVRRELASIEDQLGRVSREIDKAAELGDRDRLDDNRHIRSCLWKEKEQLRIQETVFLRILFTDHHAPPQHPQPHPANPPPPHPHHLQPQHPPPHPHPQQQQQLQLHHQPHPQPPPQHPHQLQHQHHHQQHPPQQVLQYGQGVQHGTPPGCHPMGAPHQCMPPEYMGPNTMAGHPGAANPLGPPSAAAVAAAAAAGAPPGSLVPPSPALKPSQPPGHLKNRRKASSPGPGTPGQPGSGIVMGGPPGSAGGGYDTIDMSNPEGYEVNRSSDSKVEDVWREWKEGINDGPAVEKLEEARKRDRKLVWWKHKNDYKYWSKQMRIIHAIEQKCAEFGGSVEAAIQFWEEILRVEFEGSISKLREALGGDKSSGGDGRGGGGTPGGQVGVVGGEQVAEMSNFKRQRKELLQRGLERMKQWPQQTTIVASQALSTSCT